MDKLISSTDDFELNEPLNKRELEILALFAKQQTNSLRAKRSGVRVGEAYLLLAPYAGNLI